MGRVIFVEVLDRRGDVVSRLRAEGLPLSIGRAYTNDVILDDAHVSPVHARIEPREDGPPVVVDLDSENGLFVQGRRSPVASVTLDAERRIRLGRTTLRIRDAELPLAPTQPLMRLPAPVEWMLTHWSAALALLAAVWVVEVARDHRQLWSEFEWLELLQAPLGTVAAMALWAGAWALVTRLLTHRPSFVAHWAITASALLANSAVEELFFYARFVLAPIEPLELANSVLGSALVAFALFAHLGVARVAGPGRRASVAVLVGVGLLGLQLLGGAGEDDRWVRELPYWSRLKSMDPELLPVRSAEAFFAEARGLEVELDRLAEAD